MKYTNDATGITANKKAGGEKLTNFGAQIIREIRRHDGKEITTDLIISGKMGKETLPEILVTSTEFARMEWVARSWGVKPVIYSGYDRELKVAIQETSSPITLDVYSHTGWDGNRYLHAGGAINVRGNDDTVSVDLPPDLRRYDFGNARPSKTAFSSSMRLSKIGPPEIMWPLLLAAYRAAIGDSDFSVHLSGRTGTYKSEITSLIQSHYGITMDARHLPGSWSSTAGALEALAYRAKDAIFAVDDFIPGGSAYNRNTLNRCADTLIRAQGNQSGRQRLTDTSGLQRTNYPRGIILSTGEDIPEGHSCRARMAILDLTPGDVTPDALTKSQAARAHYPSAMVGWIQHIAGDPGLLARLNTRAERYRNANLDLGHSRTPAILGQYLATADELMAYAIAAKYLTTEEASSLSHEADEAIRKMATNQTTFLRTSDPCEAFISSLRYVLAANLAHVRTKSGGIPADPERLGWTAVEESGEYRSFRSHGPTIGWIDDRLGEILIDHHQLPTIVRHSHGTISVTPQTLLKRLKDAGLLSRSDSARQRNVVRVQCAGAQRECVALRMRDVVGQNAEEIEV